MSASTIEVGSTEAETRLQIRLLGPLRIGGGTVALGPRDLGGVKPKQILEILLLARGRAVPKDRLADLLWGDRLPVNVSAALETHVSVLRRNLSGTGTPGHELVVTEPGAYRFAVEVAQVDVDRLDQLLGRAEKEAPCHRRKSLEAALALVHGDLLEDEPYAEWALSPREEYGDRLVSARLEAASIALTEHDYDAALAHAQRAIASDRFNEHAYRASALASYGQGCDHAALRILDRVRRVLGEGLGLEPADETEALRAAILRREEIASLLPPPLPQLCAIGPKTPAVPLLGRVDELKALTGQVEGALAGRFALILVEGERGIGKSRFLQEAIARLRGATVCSARCCPLERDLPYVSLATVMRGLSESSAGPVEVNRIIPAVEVGSSRPRRGHVTTLEALVEVIRQHAPLVIVLDDLHWADAATLAAISYLQRRCADVPVAVVAAFAPEDADHSHPLRRLEPTARLELAPLTPAELEPLGVEGAYERTGGNPLLVVLEATDDCGPCAVQSLREHLILRCRTASERAFSILASASVLEQPFEPTALAEIINADPVSLAEELEHLCEQRLLTVAGEGFKFRFDLLRTSLLETLSPARRRLLEARALRTERGLFDTPRHVGPTSASA